LIVNVRRCIALKLMSVQFKRRVIAMFKLASVALSAGLGVVSVAHSLPAEAHPYVSVGIGLPAVAVVEPYVVTPAYYGPNYYYAHGPYWYRGYERRWDEHHHRHFDHDGERRWDRR
jgi:hypothetical protein